MGYGIGQAFCLGTVSLSRDTATMTDDKVLDCCDLGWYIAQLLVDFPCFNGTMEAMVLIKGRVFDSDIVVE